MALTPGTRVGSYEITGPLGVGGMGEVYRATDTNLGRAVAIKVLPDAVAEDAERLSRFDREARTLATLNHPNIAAIYGVERSDGQTALVMELVEGPTLADRIAAGPVPVDEALPLAKQIAEALEAAHEQGIIHRDLKPANVKVRPDGTVKVLDFGLAKALEPVGVMSPSQSMSPTITTPAMTQAGMILGTAAYMSPEQARGRPVDRRADIWAFGCVLFEMFTGRPAFGGETVTDVLGAVVHKEPDWTRLSADVPPGVRRLLRRCLTKDARRRLHDVADARLEIEEATQGPDGEAVSGGASAAGPARTPRLWIVLAASFALLALGSTAALLTRSDPAPRVAHFTIELPDGLTYASPLGRQYVAEDPGEISPDGTQIAFTALDADTGRVLLYVRAVASLEVRPLPGTEDAFYPFWSPDSRSIAFTARGKLKRVDLSGGAPREITDSFSFSRGTWNADGDIVIGLNYWNSPLSRVSAEGGTPPVPVTTLEPGEELSHEFPQFLPDGRRFLYLSNGVQGWSVYAGSLDSDARTLVLDGVGRMAAYASGHLLFARDGWVWAQPFDPDRLEQTGDAVEVVEIADLYATIGAFGASRVFSVSGNGVLTYRTGAARPDRLVWVGRDGTELGDVLPPGDNGEPSLSPDGRRLAYASGGAIWIMDVDGGTPRQFTFDPGDQPYATWSPDGRDIAFYSARQGAPGLYRKDSRGIGAEDLVRASPRVLAPYEWSERGITAFGQYPDEAIDQNNFLIDPANMDIQQLLGTPAFEADASVSPDGQWLAYASTLTGRWEVYITSLVPSGNTGAVVTNGGGVDPRWSRSGRELYYVHSVTGDLMRIDVSTDGGIVPGEPRRIYPGPLKWGSLHSFAVTPDEERFLVWTHDPDPGDITVLLGWDRAR